MAAKAGRKAKVGERYPSGELKRTTQREKELPPNLVARQSVIERQATDHKWGSKLGLLYLEEQITAPEMRAGFAYGGFRARHDAVMGLPGRSTQSMVYGETRRSASREIHPDEIARLRERHTELLIVAGSARRLLDVVCCDDLQPSAGDILRLRGALRRVQQWLGVPDMEPVVDKAPS